MFINNQQVMLSFSGIDTLEPSTPIFNPQPYNTVSDDNSNFNNIPMLDPAEPSSSMEEDDHNTGDFSPFSNQMYGYSAPVNHQMTSLPAALNYNGSKQKSTDG